MTPRGAERSAARRGALRGPLRRRSSSASRRRPSSSARWCGANDPLWRFKKDFAKKRVLRDGAGEAWTARAREGRGGRERRAPGDDAGAGRRHDGRGARRRDRGAAAHRGRRGRAQGGEGGRRAVDRRAARPGARRSRAADARPLAPTGCPGDRRRALGRAVAFALDALEAWLAASPRRRARSGAPLAALHLPKTLDWTHLVDVVRPDPQCRSSSSAPSDERRQRLGFSLTDRRMARGARSRARSTTACSATSATRTRAPRACATPRPGAVKKNPLGVALDGCPLEEKISEMHAMRRRRATRSARWPSSRSTTRCAPAPATASATTA